DVHRLQIPYHVRRLRLLETITAEGKLRSLRGVRVTVRTRGGEIEQVLARLWTPTVETVASDLYWDRARELLWLRGEGPFFLGEHPMLRRVLEAVLDAPGFALPFAE